MYKIASINQNEKWLTNQPTNFMDQSPSSEANISAACQEILSILWKANVSYSVNKSSPRVSNLSQINSVHTPSISFL